MQASRSEDSLYLLGADKATRLQPLSIDSTAAVDTTKIDSELPLTSRLSVDQAEGSQSSSRPPRDASVPPPLPLLQFQGVHGDVAAKAVDGSILEFVHHIASRKDGQHGRELLRVNGKSKWQGKWFKQRDILERSIVQGERAAIPSELRARAKNLQWQRAYGTASQMYSLYDDAEARQKVQDDEDGGEDQTSQCLTFSADFDSANLGAAYRIFGRAPLAAYVKYKDGGGEHRPPMATEHEYDLFCKPDVHTRGHVQWFYFRVQLNASIPKGAAIRLNIVNMVKSDALYNYGMKPVVYSESAAQTQGIGWRHIGRDVAYYKNSRKQRKRPKRRQGYYSTLSFRYDVEYEGDTLYFASCFPYSYGALQQQLAQYDSDPSINSIFRRKLLCRTIGGNRCDIVTITSYVNDPRVLETRPVVVFSGRVHPGEPNSSYVIEGLMDFLLSDNPAAAKLRDTFVFKIVPMLNPDGVINGSYRCSLAGVDLNRRYENTSATLHPTVKAFKDMLSEAQHSRGILLYVDVHGHSRKKNAFVYGCDAERATRAFPDKSALLSAEQSFDQRVFTRVFPYILCSTSDVHQGGYFAYEDCSFTVRQSKRATARVVAWHDLNISAAYTLEVSLCGTGINSLDRKADEDFDRENSSFHHFGQHDLAEIGINLTKAVLQYANLCHRQGDIRSTATSDSATPPIIGTRNLPVVERLEEEPILAPCVLSASSLQRLYRKSLRAHAERTLRRLIEMVAEIQAESRCLEDDDEPLIHGLLCELREEEEEGSGGSDSDPSVDNVPASTLYLSKEWREFCTNPCVALPGNGEFSRYAESFKTASATRGKSKRPSKRHRYKHSLAQRLPTANKSSHDSQQLQLGLSVVTRSKRGGASARSDDIDREMSRQACQTAMQSPRNNFGPKRLALHPLRAAVAKQAQQQQRQLFAMASVGSINMWTSSKPDGQTSEFAEPEQTLHRSASEYQLRHHKAVRRRDIPTVLDSGGMMTLRNRPMSRAGNPFTKHVPMRIIYSPKFESEHTRKVPLVQSLAETEKKILLGDSNATSDGFSVLNQGRSHDR